MRRFAVGAEPGPEGTHFRVWAPAARRLEVVERNAARSKSSPRHALTRSSDGYFEGRVAELSSGDLYSLRIDDQERPLPDPASRFQPNGPHGPSQIVDPSRYAWGDSDFRGTLERGQVLYEMHIGTFTREGTYRAAAEQLAPLAELGITTLELMPVAEFPGEFGWGYDGVGLWAPTRLYGTPDDLRGFIDRAHQLQMAVILDVVYNHLGPDGAYLQEFASDYFTDRYENEWGKAINFDGPRSGPVREFFLENARHWLLEYHFDGLRLDATQSLFDASGRHIIADIARVARSTAQQQQKRVYIAAENEPQHTVLVRAPEQGGYGCDALWNDDFHHTVRVAATGRREAYCHDYTGTPQELISALRWGYLYQGQHYHWQKKPRGSSGLDLEARNFITYLQNHDQIANSIAGARIGQLCEPARLRALTTLWLLSPPTPLLFQGQEFGASAPFLYFADHNPELSPLVREGRKEFLLQFPSMAAPGIGDTLADPSDRATFERCKLDFSERKRHAPLYALHRDLLGLRRQDPVFREQRADQMYGAVLGPEAFLLRFASSAGDRLLVVNLGADLDLDPAPEPLLAPPSGSDWSLILSSEDVKYGGAGFAPPHAAGVWKLTARSAGVLVATEAS
ncbi:MAG TPA: malto-oligosyltrehalose trehalohydrolase [Polyangiaceae bacterium]|nr:malto-oligosyltrehalose trehalohydrolase [Polyangiaceae bacterium]